VSADRRLKTDDVMHTYYYKFLINKHENKIAANKYITLAT